MQQYPYLSPIILTDTIFLNYGGLTGTSTSAQRSIAYGLAEEQMTEYLSTFLIPTTVTGTYWIPTHTTPLALDYGYVTQIKDITIYSANGNYSCSVDSTSDCYGVRGNGKYGLLDVNYLLACGGCIGLVGIPCNVQVSYECGLQTGTSYQPSMLQALTLAAQINLNELDVSLSNEGTADVGITEFTNLKYSEKRMTLGNTVFGNSPTANRVARLVRKYKTKVSIGFH